MAAIDSSVTSTTAERHQKLESKNRTTKCSNEDDAFEKYAKKNLNVRKLTVQAKFLSIENEKTTVRFMIEGIIGHDKYGPVAQIIQVSGLPASVKLMTDSVNDFFAVKERQQVYAQPKGLGSPAKVSPTASQMTSSTNWQS